MPMRPVAIPPTTPRRYVSFHRALNLRREGELTGDWHALTAWFHADDGVVLAPLAGTGERIDTTPALSTLGVREMGVELRRQGVPAPGRVWVANHPRAIADLVMLDLVAPRTPMIAGVRQINAWLDTRAQVDELREIYLVPIKEQLRGRPRDVLEAWLPRVEWF